MKYVVIIPDGAADQPLEELEGKTPLEAAATPNLDALARRGRVGSVQTTPKGFEAGSDVCCMSLLGYDPAVYHTGRAPLEAAALGLEFADTDWVMRLNLVTAREAAGSGSGGPHVMIDHSAGGIEDDPADELLRGLAAHWSQDVTDLVDGLALAHGVSYRSILVDSSGRDYAGVELTPPHEIPNEPIEPHLPRARDKSGQVGAEALARLMLSSQSFLRAHPINAARVASGDRPATMAWIWGQGRKPALASFESLHGVRGAMITGVDLLAGLATLIGWDCLEVEGAGSFHEGTDYEQQGQAAVAAIDEYDLVCCHVESPDEASHQADWETKIAAIEAIDEHVVGPIAERLRACGDPEEDGSMEGWRLMVLPDHYTLVSTRRHDATAVPFLIAGSWIRSVVERSFTEREALESDVHIAAGHELMEYFLRSGLARVVGRPAGD